MPTIVLGVKGSATSGNIGHAGRPGLIGGSRPKNYGAAVAAWSNLTYNAQQMLGGPGTLNTLNRVGLQAIIDYEGMAINGTQALAIVQSPQAQKGAKIAPAAAPTPAPQPYTAAQVLASQQPPVTPPAPTPPSAPMPAPVVPPAAPVPPAKFTPTKGQVPPHLVAYQQQQAANALKHDVDLADLGFAVPDRNNPGQLYVKSANMWALSIPPKTNAAGQQAIKDYKAGKITEDELHQALSPAYKSMVTGDWHVGNNDTQAVRQAKSMLESYYGDFIRGNGSRDDANNLANAKWISQINPSTMTPAQWGKVNDFHRGMITEGELQKALAPFTVAKTPKAPPVPKVGKAKPSAADAITPAKVSGDPTKLSCYQSVLQGSEVPGHGCTGDGVLGTIVHEQGFDGKPHLISRAEFNQYVAAGEQPIYRGCSQGRSDAHRAQRYNDWRSGDYFAGYGMFGNGTYTSNFQKTARDYDSDRTGSILAMTIKPGAKIIDYDAAAAGARSYRQTLPRYTNDYGLTNDVGHYAAAMGYDAIVKRAANYNAPIGKQEDFYIILNRTAVRVVTEDFTIKDDTERYW